MKKTDKSVILLVDDKPANILALEGLLEAKDRILLRATSGEEALKMTLHKDIDLIILDVQMPDMDGFEVAQILQTNKRTRDIPLVFATAENKEHKFMMKGYDEGAFDYLFKPLDPEIVNAKVTVLLKLQMQRKELVEKNESLQKSALLINNSADIIGIIDATSFRIEEMNNAFTTLLGYTPDEVKGAIFTSFFEDGEYDLIQELGLQNKDRLSFDTRILSKDHSIKWLQWKVVVKDGKWFVNARDITELKQADEKIRELNHTLQANILQLQASNKELESFSYSVSHDLRSPLRAMSGYSKILEENYQPILDEEAKRLLGNIRSNAARMGVLIDDLLEFSRLGRKALQKSDLDMGNLVKTVLMELNKSNSHPQHIHVQDLPHIDADHGLIRQVWENLISNAIKYSSKKEKPEIEIGANCTETSVTYYIKDNGAGFDMKYADKLFGVFQRLHKPTEFEGTGVGLAIVHRIITRHGGRVWADAKRNEGATFYFSLPNTTH
jgi:PAS domain S-box-containing protein